MSKLTNLYLKYRLCLISGHVVGWMCRETSSGTEHLKCWLQITSFPKHEWDGSEVRKQWLRKDREWFHRCKS